MKDGLTRIIDSGHAAEDTFSSGDADIPTGQRAGVNSSTASSPFRLNVQPIAAEDARLPKPAIREVAGDVLDMATFNGDAHATLAPWPLMAAGQRLWLEAHTGSNDVPIVSGYVVTAGDVDKTLSYDISRSMLESLPNGAIVTIRPRVALNGSSDERDRILYPARTFTLRKARPGWEDFESAELGEYPRFTSDVVDILSTKYTKLYIDHAPSGMSGKALRLEVPNYYLDSQTLINGQIPATSISFRYTTSVALTFNYGKNGLSQSVTLPTGTQTFKMTGMMSSNTSITRRGTPFVFWLDDILFE